MRPRLIAALVWLFATALATAVGFTATHIVGDVIRGSVPIGAEYRPASDRGPGQASGALSSRSRTFDYPGGQLTATCNGRAATLIDKTAAVGWKLVDFEAGPDEDIDVTFTRGPTSFRIEVYCNEGEPTAVVSEP